MTDRKREYCRRYMRAYRAKMSSAPEWLAEYREKSRARMREWRARKAQDPAWLAAHREKERRRVKAYWAAHPEKHRENWRKWAERHGVERRAKERIRHAVKAVKERGAYIPRFNMRKPDWVAVGQNGIDTRSPFIWNNLTDGQRAYGRELAIERKERRAAR